MIKITYSWVLPIKDEKMAIPQLIWEIKKAMQNRSFEIIAIDDASTDNSGLTLEKLSKKMPQLKIIHFKTHQGKWAALREGIKNSNGSIIITSDSDGQDKPSEVKKLLEQLEEGFDLVSGWRKKRHDPYYKILISRVGNYLISKLSQKEFKDLNSPFKIYRREVLAGLPKEGSLLRFSLLFAYKLCFRTREIPIIHRPRIYGKSKFGVIKYIRILYDLLLVYLLFSGSGRPTRAE